MAVGYQWKPKSLGAERVDPYSRWLVDAGATHWDIEKQTPGELRSDPWVASYVKDLSGLDRLIGQLSTENLTTAIWAPHGEDHAFVVAQRPLPSQPLEQQDPEASEAYVQLAPFDGPESFVGAVCDPVAPDMTRFDIESDRAVICGVIDDGVNIAHERFLDSRGRSRVDFAWVQDGNSAPASSVLFGREFTSEAIEGTLANFDTEEMVLRHLGLINHASQRPTTLSKAFSHGSFVLDMLAGYGVGAISNSVFNEETTTCPSNRRIISVQLHRRVSEESSGALYPLFAILGLQYIVDRGRRVAQAIRQGKGRKVPLVVNFSYGLSGGPHNGDHLFEQFAELMVRKLDNDPDLGPLILPMPTGNRHLLNGHAHIQAEADGNARLELDWITQPQDRSPNYLEIWVPCCSEQEPMERKISVSLRPPPGAEAAACGHTFDLRRAAELPGQDLFDENDHLIARITLDKLDGDHAKINGFDCSTAKVRVLIALASTTAATDAGASAPPGLWRITVESELSAGQFIEAWIPRDDSPPYFRRRGRQSFLENRRSTPADQRADELSEFVRPLEPGCGLSRHGTLSGLASGRSMLRVGGVRFYDNSKPSLYSGGPHDGMRAVEVSAPADRSRVCAGLIGAGGRSGSTQLMNGTSVSAPMVGRAVADFLETHTAPTTEAAVRDFIMSLSPDTETAAVPEHQAASGQLDDTITAAPSRPDLKKRRSGKILPIPHQPADAQNSSGLHRHLRR